jgi:hypothetical protein
MQKYRVVLNVRQKRGGNDGKTPVAITTWTGEVLGTVMGFYSPYRDNFGGKRQRFSMRAVNGQLYHGEYYLSSGDYCRIRKYKGAA